MLAPDRVYSLYREIAARPAAIVRSANPRTFPHMIRDPRFVEEVRAEGRFTGLLEHFGLFPASGGWPGGGLSGLLGALALVPRRRRV